MSLHYEFVMDESIKNILLYHSFHGLIKEFKGNVDFWTSHHKKLECSKYN